MAKTKIGQVSVNLLSELPECQRRVIRSRNILGSACTVESAENGDILLVTYRGWTAVMSTAGMMAECVIQIEEEMRSQIPEGENGNEG